ncbi:hypothetical protein [Hoylesella enoeca]|nr:hypothetical protein [Hoylesella enoeca]
MNKNKTKWIFAATLLLATACASDDTTQTGEQKNEPNTKGYTTFVAGKESTQTRTSLDYDTGNFFWESGDNIFVKDDAGIWQTGSNAVSGTEKSYYKFLLSGAFAGTSYTVFYPGKNGTNDQVTIATAQTQATPADTKHLGEAGDCGIGTATGSSAGFGFKLNHKAAILVFQPYTNDALLKDCYLTKIEVISDNNIAGTYTLDPITKKLTGSGASNTITLNTIGTGAYSNGFPMTNTSANLSTNGAYMVIAPGHHKLRIRYWLMSPTELYLVGSGLMAHPGPLEGTITRDLPIFNYEENNYYDMRADLKVAHYPISNQYYLWDAQQEFWYGHESDQPMENMMGDAPESLYPQNNSDPRWYNEAVFPATASHSAATCPNVNELCWYVQDGDPHWDNNTLWATGGHLTKGGMWLKTQTKIAAANGKNVADLKIAAPDGIDHTTSTAPAQVSNSLIASDMPDANNMNNYFYLPALGQYGKSGGNIVFMQNGYLGYYWSSTPAPSPVNCAYSIGFTNYTISVAGSGTAQSNNRSSAFRLWKADDSDGKYRPIGM